MPSLWAGAVSWVKLDDKFTGHTKVLAAGPEAAWLHLEGLCYCAQAETAGGRPGGLLPGQLGQDPRPDRPLGGTEQGHGAEVVVPENRRVQAAAVLGMGGGR